MLELNIFVCFGKRTSGWMHVKTKAYTFKPTNNCHADQLGAKGAELETAKEQLAKIVCVCSLVSVYYSLANSDECIWNMFAADITKRSNRKSHQRTSRYANDHHSSFAPALTVVFVAEFMHHCSVGVDNTTLQPALFCNTVICAYICVSVRSYLLHTILIDSNKWQNFGTSVALSMSRHCYVVDCCHECPLFLTTWSRFLHVL